MANYVTLYETKMAELRALSNKTAEDIEGLVDLQKLDKYRLKALIVTTDEIISNLCAIASRRNFITTITN